MIELFHTIKFIVVKDIKTIAQMWEFSPKNRIMSDICKKGAVKGEEKCFLAREIPTRLWNQVDEISKKYCGNTHQSREKVWENAYMLLTMKGIRIP